MKSFTHGRRLLLSGILAGALAIPALAQAGPDGTISIHGGSAGFIAGIHWGDGRLHFHGKTHQLKIGGLSGGMIGGSTFDASGEVYNLHRVSDIEGTYGTVEASATAGAGAGAMDLKNDKGVEIRLNTSSAGLKLSLGPGGMSISLK